MGRSERTGGLQLADGARRRRHGGAAVGLPGLTLERAKAEELMRPVGIGEARARAIIEVQPCVRKDELVRKKIIPEFVDNDIKDKIIAKK